MSFSVFWSFSFNLKSLFFEFPLKALVSLDHFVWKNQELSFPCNKSKWITLLLFCSPWGIGLGGKQECYRWILEPVLTSTLHLWYYCRAQRQRQSHCVSKKAKKKEREWKIKAKSTKGVVPISIKHSRSIVGAEVSSFERRESFSGCHFVVWVSYCLFSGWCSW